MNKRNLVRQEIALKDKETGEPTGETKVIYHKKKFNQPQYANYRQVWHQANTTAKYNSKRQKLLRGEIVEDKN